MTLGKLSWYKVPALCNTPAKYKTNAIREAKKKVVVVVVAVVVAAAAAVVAAVVSGGSL